MIDQQVSREPLNPEEIKIEIDDVFTFNAPVTEEQINACLVIQEGCYALARAITEVVPEGKEQTVAINNVLATALWARHGITRRNVSVVAMPAPVATAWDDQGLPKSISIEGQPTLAEEASSLKNRGAHI